MKSGYLYVLTHPSDPNLYKIGVTILDPKKRLAQHNSQHEKPAGKIVKETGQKWEIRTFISVPDPYWAESAFWGATPFADIPYRYGIEIGRMEWKQVQRALDAAKLAGVRPGPAPLPDHVHAYTASIKKRLEGRGITLVGYVRSVVSGKSVFRCDNGHEWRTISKHVGEGQGCPVCGIGERDPEQIRKQIRAGVICLLTHPEKPGFVQIGISYSTLDAICKKWPWDKWEIHRYRNTEEVALAESLAWELLGKPLPHDRKPIQKGLIEAENAFRRLIYAIREKVALDEQRKEAVRTID